MVQVHKKQKRCNKNNGSPSSSVGNNIFESMLQNAENSVSWSEFVEHYFEKKPLFLRRLCKQREHPPPFSRDQLLQLADRHDLEPSQMTICKYVDQERQNLELDEQDTVSESMLAKSFQDGYSVQFYQPQRYSDALYDINASFERQFGALAGSSAYLTPPGAQALAPHFDDVEVFVIQTEGKKRWKVYAPIDELPAEHSGDLGESDLTDLLLDIELSPGDMLYFPRGFIHQATAVPDMFSTHVSVSVYQYNTWGNFMELAIPRLLRTAFENDKAFRQGLPINYLQFMGTQYQTQSSQKALAFTAHFQQLMQELTDSIIPDELHQAADEASMDFFSSRLPPPESQSEAAEKEPDIEMDMTASFCIVDPSYIRLMIEHDPEPVVKVIQSHHNDRMTHMGPRDDEPVVLSFPYSSLSILLHLVDTFPQPTSVAQLPGDELEIQKVVCVLHAQGLLKFMS